MPWPCGLADFTRGLLTELVRLDHDVTIVTSNANAANASASRVEMIPGNWGPSHVQRVRKFCMNQRFDVLDMQYERAAYKNSLSLFFSSRRRHTRLQGDWSSDVCSSD